VAEVARHAFRATDELECGRSSPLEFVEDLAERPELIGPSGEGLARAISSGSTP
jgi:hypothetical protein